MWLDTLSRVCHGVADVEVVILLVLLGKGWTIVRHKLRVASRMKLAAFAATYAMASFACLALCGNQSRAPPAIDATCFPSCVCAMAWRFHAIDATLSPMNLTHWLISTQAWRGRSASETTSRCSSPTPVRRVSF